jgi:hypothetical protein
MPPRSGSTRSAASPSFTESARRRLDSARDLHGTGSTISVMDIVAVLLGIVMFAALLGLIYGIERV